MHDRAQLIQKSQVKTQASALNDINKALAKLDISKTKQIELLAARSSIQSPKPTDKALEKMKDLNLEKKSKKKKIVPCFSPRLLRPRSKKN